MKDNEQRVLEHLDRAIEATLTARAMLGGLGDAQVPDAALNVALRDSPDVRDARREFLAALSSIDVAGDAVARQTYLRIEEAANALVTTSADMGYRVGLLAARAGSKTAQK